MWKIIFIDFMQMKNKQQTDGFSLFLHIYSWLDGLLSNIIHFFTQLISMRKWGSPYRTKKLYLFSEESAFVRIRSNCLGVTGNYFRNTLITISSNWNGGGCMELSGHLKYFWSHSQKTQTLCSVLKISSLHFSEETQFICSWNISFLPCIKP